MYEDTEEQSNWNTEITCNKVGGKMEHNQKGVKQGSSKWPIC